MHHSPKRVRPYSLDAKKSLAQEKPEVPKPKTDRKVFFVSVSLLAASKTADAITTRRVLDFPDGRGSELNPLFGPHLSPAGQAGINLGIFAAQSTAFYFTERSRHKWIRWTGRAFLAHEIEEHSRLAACNAGLDIHSPVTQNCGSVTPF